MEGNASRIQLGGNFRRDSPVSDDEVHRQAARQLLDRQGLPGEFVLEALPCGRNNRVWRIRRPGSDFLLKKYYWAENDQRDRMGHEWDFLTYLHGIGCSLGPRALAVDRESRYALIEFIAGTGVSISGITDQGVFAAADFFSSMNAGRYTSAALALAPASEACFSLEEHVETMERRIRRLGEITSEDEMHREAADFVSVQLLPLWNKARGLILERAAEHGGLTRKLDARERCLSPSDFGFHNAIKTADGTLRFVDFEYSGWDDPAKTIADFANQPDRLLPDAMGGLFRERALALFPDNGQLAARLRLLTPLYQVKWACICLNEFLPSGSHRRAFTGQGGDDAVRHLSDHLDRARIMQARAESNLDA